MTESIGHPINSKNMGKTDLGGEFFTQKRFVQYAPPRTYSVRSEPKLFSNPDRWRFYSGTELALATDPSNIPSYSDAYSNDVTLDALGATAIARIKPDNPVAGLTAALAEIRTGGLPHLSGSQTWQDGVLTAQNAGGEYLNTQFGWIPLISDISDFAGGVTHASSVIEQYKRGIGKNIRRTYDFPIETTTTEQLLSNAARPFTGLGGSNRWSGGSSQTGYLFRTKVIVRRQWFKGCFTYYFPSKILGSERLADLAILAQQLGLTVTPDVVWQVTPWSWAIDWFSNTGDVIANWSSFHDDGLVMRYGYMMENTIITDTYSLVGARDVSGYAHPVSDVTFITETKVRRKANPYGFGVSWDGLSPFQASILVALGISR